MIPDIHENISKINVNGRVINVILDLKLPRIVVFQNFLSDIECENLIKLAKHRLTTSSTVDNVTGSTIPHPSRTSDGMFFQRGENELVKKIENRIATVINWPVESGEGLQILRYQNGQRYLPHNDYFDPAHPGTKVLTSKGGNRVGTFILYLSTPEEGGATFFPDADIRISAIRGNALFFNYPIPTKETKTLHEGQPVINGTKYIATKWLREGNF